MPRNSSDREVASGKLGLFGVLPMTCPPSFALNVDFAVSAEPNAMIIALAF